MIGRHTSSTWVWAERLKSNKAGVTKSRHIKRKIIFFVAAAYRRLISLVPLPFLTQWMFIINLPSKYILGPGYPSIHILYQFQVHKTSFLMSNLLVIGKSSIDVHNSSYYNFKYGLSLKPVSFQWL